jgi:hypothetical protein
MSWNLRLQQMIMAGGVFSFSACGSNHGLGHVLSADADTTPGDASAAPMPTAPIAVPIGNGCPDPTCGRGTAAGATGEDAAGGTGGDATGGDAAAEDVGTAPVTPWNPIPIGNAMPDPCYSERVADGPAAQLCLTCLLNGGQWQSAVSTQPARCLGGRDAGASDADASDASDGNPSHE